jgi:DNA-binding response OmpR family regulator
VSEHRILVVEDDRSVGKVVEVSLGLAGHEVELATDVRAGEAAVRTNGHGLVILDVNLPGGTGLELLRLLMAEVWDANWYGSTKTLDVHISWLRKKLEADPSDPRYITTHRGVGFRFASAEEASAAG